ncbi:MAG: hypothetical protein HYT80_08770 [Euryarchaeota archaeon]|nr:hypothetical protein [Euryarchaeota archaeon]
MAAATIKACEQGAELAMIPQAAFREALAADAALRARVEAVIAERKQRNAALASSRPAPVG